MTKSEYQELVEFLAGKFGRIDRRFDGIDERFEEVDRRFDAIDERFEEVDRRFDAVDERFDAIDERFEQVDRRFEQHAGGLGGLDLAAEWAGFETVLQVERNRDEIRIVAEGVSALDEKFDRFRAELDGRFQEQRELLFASHHTLDRRVTSLEERVDRLEEGD